MMNDECELGLYSVNAPRMAKPTHGWETFVVEIVAFIGLPLASECQMMDVSMRGICPQEMGEGRTMKADR